MTSDLTVVLAYTGLNLFVLGAWGIVALSGWLAVRDPHAWLNLRW